MPVAERVVTIPYRPRPLQLAIHKALDENRFAVAVCHRRFGKTVLAVNQLIKRAVLCGKSRPRFAYIAPTYRMGKAIAWDYLKFYTADIPGVAVNESELRIDFKGLNGAQIRIYGADNPDALRGIYLDGCVLDEFGLQPPKVFSEVVRPLLADREGWALFIGTPNGKNQFYDIAQKAQQEDGWFFAEYRASVTGYVPAHELGSARKDMSADEYAQEWECSFEASVKGAVYIRELQVCREGGRITMVPYEPLLEVDTAWDLGMRDATAIWFVQQSHGREVRLIDYYEANGAALDHYVKVLKEKPYVYGTHYAPHDIQVKEFSTGHTRFEMAQSLGVHFHVVPQTRLQDGIQAARAMFPRCYFDQTRTKQGLEALQNYRWDFNTATQWTKTAPVHNWASHGADAFRTFAVGHQLARKPKAGQTLRAAQRDTDPDERRSIRGGGFRRQRLGGY